LEINKYFIHEENELLGNMIFKTSMLSKKSPTEEVIEKYTVHQ